ncbi:MAG: ferritin family protein [Candidatus Aminicenantes bacterium]|nr:ferritin family protein [Candidatus Aminicenantes bacterium]MDH5467310.1 ferritin family protein [Candidatus Aminicenantes bacterium]MDH5705514.1 ferritin family protein [Candidatus Aminicenantes bacterium]
MDTQTFEGIVKFAIEREEEAIKAYGSMIEISKTPGLKELLAELQNEERNHKKLLQELTEEKAESLKVEDVMDLKISDYLVEEPPSEEMNFQDLLILAAKKEQKAVDLYSSLVEKAKEEEIRKLFEFLVMQEKSHKLKLEKEYETRVLEWD